MSEMRYTYWSRGEPNNAGGRDAKLKRVSPPLPEKCVQLCRGTNYRWNDAVCEIPMCSICEVDIKTTTHGPRTLSDIRSEKEIDQVQENNVSEKETDQVQESKKEIDKVQESNVSEKEIDQVQQSKVTTQDDIV